MDERLKGFFQILFAVFVIGVSLYFSVNIKQFESFGYFGVFLISILSAATIFIPAPGWAVVVAMGRVLDPYYVGIIAGVGAGIGELTGYNLGAGAAHILHKKFGNHIDNHKGWIKKYDILAIGLLAFIPNPLFDVAGLISGSLGITVWRFFLACVIGRIFRYVLLAFLGAFSLQYF